MASTGRVSRFGM